MEKTVDAPAARVPIVQTVAPVALPADGFVQLAAGPDICVSETKVVFAGTPSVSTTFCASSGPRLITETV
jgi:hypothetical protein